MHTIAVLGAGLSGLSAAWSLSHRFPAAQILLFEKAKRLGGWPQSERITLPHHRTVLLEAGPRTLRPNGAAVLELIKHLGLENELITVAKTSPAASKRYIYVPPGEISGISGLNVVGPDLSSPIMKRFLWPLLRAPLRFALRKHSRDGKDESIHSFAARIVGEDVARVIGSAIAHGVYAADSRQLSAHSTLPFWSPRDASRVLTDPHSTIESDILQPYPNVGKLGETMRGVAVYSFRSGMETLTRALEQHLSKRSNVQIFRESPVLSLLMKKDQSFELTYLSPHANSTSLSIATPTHVVSALPLPALHRITRQPRTDTNSLSTSRLLTSLPSIPHLTTNTSSTVHVLNLVFPTSPSNIHPPGFGYLIPRPKDGYPIEASEAQPGILGTVFDSCSLSQQDIPEMSTDEYYECGTHTKMTVMLGGPHPLFIPPSAPTSPSPRPKDVGGVGIPPYIRTILNHISTHLGRELSDPVYWRLWKNEDCIPTYGLGHSERMQEVREVLEKSVPEGWGGRVEVVGAGVGGVSVSDCVLGGRNAGLRWLLK